MLRSSLSLIVLLIFSPCHVFAQKNIASISLKSAKITNLQSFHSGNALFVSFFDLGVHRASLVYPDGNQEDIFFQNVPGVTFCSLENDDGDLFLYFFEKRKKGETALRAYHYNRARHVNIVGDYEIAISGEIIGINDEKGLSIFTRIQNQIVEYKVSHLKVLGQEKYSIPPQYSQFIHPGGIQLITSTTGWPYEAFAKTKIYPALGNLFLTIDYEGGTILFKLRPTGEISSITLPELFKTSHSSFLRDSMLFRLSMKFRAFSLKIFNANNGSLISEKEMTADEVEPESKIYFHSGRGNVTTHKASLKRMLMNVVEAEPAITANLTSPGTYAITYGAYSNENGPGMVGGGSPLAMLITFAVTTSINQLSRGPAISLYSYFTYDKDEINFKQTADPIFKKMDDFYISRAQREIKLEDVIVTSLHEIFAVVHNENAKTLEVIKIED